MGRALLRIKWLDNHGLQVVYPNEEPRFIGPDGWLTMNEASMALGTYREMLDRMIARKRLVSKQIEGVKRVPMSEVLRLRRAWKVTGRPTGRLERTHGRGAA
jgi:hypothetical protein